MADEQKISDEAAWAFDESASAHRKKHGGTFRHCCTRAGVEAAYSLIRKQWEAERDEADRRWNDAIDWLLNSRHTADQDCQEPFWAYCDGLITREELDTFGWKDVEQRKAERGETDD